MNQRSRLRFRTSKLNSTRQNTGTQLRARAPDHQFGADARSFAIALARDVDLDELAEEDEPERHHQDEDQDRHRPEDEGLVGVGGADVAHVEGALPHDQQHGDREHNRHRCRAASASS